MDYNLRIEKVEQGGYIITQDDDSIHRTKKYVFRNFDEAVQGIAWFMDERPLEVPYRTVDPPQVKV